MSRSRTYILLVVGVIFMGADVFAMGTWASTLLIRVHGLQIHQIATIIGPVRGTLVAVGVVLGGFLTDRLGRADPRWRLYIPGLACLAVVPADLAFLLGDAKSVWMSGFVASSLLTLLHQGPIYAAVLSVAQQRMRATATAIMLLCSSLLGMILGPLLIGWLNDRLSHLYGPFAIRYSMLCLVVGVAFAGLCFCFAARSLEADARRAAGDL